MSLPAGVLEVSGSARLMFGEFGCASETDPAIHLRRQDKLRGFVSLTATKKPTFLRDDSPLLPGVYILDKPAHPAAEKFPYSAGWGAVSRMTRKRSKYRLDLAA